MKCMWCGGEMRDEDKFCPHCGNATEETAAESGGQATAESGNPSGGSNAKYWLIGLAVVIAILVIIFMMAGGGTETYVGTDVRWDITVTLKNDDTFEIKEESLVTGSVTTVTGTYEKLGSNDSVILFKPTSGKAFRCEIKTNIYGTPFITYSGIACYKS